MISLFSIFEIADKKYTQEQLDKANKKFFSKYDVSKLPGGSEQKTNKEIAKNTSELAKRFLGK